MDYAPAALWISQPFGLGRIYPGFALWITHLRCCRFPSPSGSGAYIRCFASVDYAADAAVDYGPDGPVDYDASHLWISQPFGLGRIYPHLRCCGLAALRGEPSSLGTGCRLPNEPGATLASLAHPRL